MTTSASPGILNIVDDDKVTVPTLGGVEANLDGSVEKPAAKKPRGFAAMDRAAVSEIARKGGKAAHAAGTAHEFTSAEARVAGRKGGVASHAKRRASQT